MTALSAAADLHAGVLEALSRVADYGGCCAGCCCGCAHVAVLRRIAERHAPSPYGRGMTACEFCYEAMTLWPCPDFRDVAAAVGVSVDA